MVALGEHRANADDAVEERFQKQLARVLVGAGVPLADGGANLLVRHVRAEVQEPPRDVEVRDGLKIEHNIVGHGRPRSGWN